MDRRNFLKVASVAIPAATVAFPRRAFSSEWAYLCPYGEVDAASPVKERRITLYKAGSEDLVWVTIDATEEAEQVGEPSYGDVNPSWCTGSNEGEIWLSESIVNSGPYQYFEADDPKYPTSGSENAGLYATTAAFIAPGIGVCHRAVKETAYAIDCGALTRSFAQFSQGDHVGGYTELLKEINDPTTNPALLKLLATLEQEATFRPNKEGWIRYVPNEFGQSWKGSSRASGRERAVGKLSFLYQLLSALGFVAYVQNHPVAAQHYSHLPWFSALKTAATVA